MRKEDQIGYQIKELGRLLDRNIYQKSILSSGGDTVTAMNGWMISYLYHHRDQDIFQKDLETEFHMAKSSVTCALQGLERNGYIQRVSVERDARLKKIQLTESGLRFHKAVEVSIQEMEEKMTEHFSGEQVEELFSMLRQIKSQLEVEIASNNEKIRKERERE